MNKDVFGGKWKQLKGSAKEKWGKLTDDDLARMEGGFDQAAGTLQEKYGWSKEEARAKLNDWFNSSARV